MALRLTLKSLGRKITDKRGANGIRAAAAEIGISPATLSRVERGNLPDLETFKKIMRERTHLSDSIAAYRARLGDASAEVIRLVGRDLDRAETQPAAASKPIALSAAE